MKSTIDYKVLGNNIKKYRVSNNLTQEKLGEKAGLSSTHISNIENGKTKVSLESLVAIANVFECNVEVLLKYSLENSKTEYSNLYAELLSDCSLEEARLIVEVSKQIKKSYTKIIKPLL